MKTLNKLNDLFKKLDKAEVLIDGYTKSLLIAPFRAISKALEKTSTIRVILEHEIIKVADIRYAKRWNLKSLEKEYKQFMLAIESGLCNPADAFDLKDEIKNLENEINERIN